MRRPDGHRLYTSPCGIRTKWPSGKRTPLYVIVYNIERQNHYKMFEIIKKIEKKRLVPKQFQTIIGFMLPEHPLIQKGIGDKYISSPLT